MIKATRAQSTRPGAAPLEAKIAPAKATPVRRAGAKRVPGLAFQEVGIGYGKVDGKTLPIQARLSMKVTDEAAFVNDPTHTLRARGTMTINGKSHVVQGTLNLMQKVGNVHFLVYTLESTESATPAIRFAGAKEVYNENGLSLKAVEDLLHDLTVVQGRFFQPGEAMDGIRAAEVDPQVRLVFPGSYKDFFGSFHALSQSLPVALKGFIGFGKVFLGGLNTFEWPFGVKPKNIPDITKPA